MAAQPNFSDRFVRKTRLSANEYHKNFLKLDKETIAVITSAEADKVTTLMSKIYLRMVNAPSRFWEREGVLRFEAEFREGRQVKAWTVLCEMLGVASATANKALRWLHEQGVIGYFAGKNGVGLRIFLNRAGASIGIREPSKSQKILHFSPASSVVNHASQDETAFNDSFAVREVSELDFDPRAPKSGADAKQNRRIESNQPMRLLPHSGVFKPEKGREPEPPARYDSSVSVNEFAARLRIELEPCVKAAAMLAAERTAAREIALTREWFENKALPKAVRVAQHETYQLLRKNGCVDERGRHTRVDLEVGRSRSGSQTTQATRRLTPEEIREAAETCVALFEAQGKSIDATLTEIGPKGCGWFLPEDEPQVREAALSLLRERCERG